MNRFARPAISRSRRVGGSRQTFVAIAAVGAVLALGAVATNDYVTAAKRDAAGDTYRASTDDATHTHPGSILYMPDTSNLCHQWLFDNQSGRFSDNGSVDSIAPIRDSTARNNGRPRAPK